MAEGKDGQASLNSGHGRQKTGSRFETRRVGELSSGSSRWRSSGKRHPPADFRGPFAKLPT